MFLTATHVLRPMSETVSEKTPSEIENEVIPRPRVITFCNERFGIIISSCSVPYNIIRKSKPASKHFTRDIACRIHEDFRSVGLFGTKFHTKFF